MYYQNYILVSNDNTRTDLNTQQKIIHVVASSEVYSKVFEDITVWHAYVTSRYMDHFKCMGLVIPNCQ